MVEGFEDLREWHYEATGGARSIYSIDQAQAPAVVLLHELPGLSKDCIRFGRDLHAAGFAVHMPLMFGQLGQGAPMKGLYQMWCLRKEFELFRNGRTSPISGWIRALCDHLGSADDPVGVVGMCATGGLIMSVMYEPAVGAAVSAQPALPFRLFYTAKRQANLGGSVADVAASVASGTPLMLTRFARDPMCPANRGAAMEEAFAGSDFVRYEAHGWRHATLSIDAAHSGAVPHVIEFLTQRLMPS